MGGEVRQQKAVTSIGCSFHKHGVKNMLPECVLPLASTNETHWKMFHPYIVMIHREGSSSPITAHFSLYVNTEEYANLNLSKQFVL